MPPPNLRITDPRAAAAGDVEIGTDGTSVITSQGWPEMRLALFARRPRRGPGTIGTCRRRRCGCCAAG